MTDAAKIARGRVSAHEAFEAAMAKFPKTMGHLANSDKPSAQNSKGSQMSDELKVWREACFAYGGASIEGAELEPSAAAAVIRQYGDERYQAAIADVVEWLGEQEKRHSTFTWYGVAANEITRRFGKDA